MSQYAWKFKAEPEKDIGVFEILRKKNEIIHPFTVVIEDYSKLGDKQLFSDLFYSSDWDEGRKAKVSDDVKFCVELWKELGLEESEGEPFHPKHIEHDLDRIPKVYRNYMDAVLGNVYPCGHNTEYIQEEEYDESDDSQDEDYVPFNDLGGEQTGVNEELHSSFICGQPYDNEYKRYPKRFN